MSMNLDKMENFICPKCNKIFSLKISEKMNHIRWCNIDEIGNKIPSFKKININDINWNDIQAEYDVSHSWKQVIKKLNLSRKIIDYGKKHNLLSKNKKPFHTTEIKKIISEKRKEWLKNNPNKHCWKNNKKFTSVPCEYVKNILRNKNISFVEEFQPLKDRGFSIDIAFPNNKIGIEINGNQHYNSDGTLKEYYENRHNIIESNGWKLYEIPYTNVYKKEFDFMLNNILTGIDISIQYVPHFKNQNKKYTCSKCGGVKTKGAKQCYKCSLKDRNKNIPSKEELMNDIKSFSFLSLSKKYGVSDNAIRKWAKKYGIYNCRKIQLKKK